MLATKKCSRPPDQFPRRACLSMIDCSNSRKSCTTLCSGTCSRCANSRRSTIPDQIYFCLSFAICCNMKNVPWIDALPLLQLHSMHWTSQKLSFSRGQTRKTPPKLTSRNKKVVATKISHTI
jgi:hypothetical protein